MASACVNNIGVSPDTFLDCPAAYPWLNPRISFGRDHSDESKLTGSKPPAPPVPEDNPTGPSDPDPDPDPEVFGPDFGGFEFRLLEDPVTMLPADELFSDGKLMPLQLSMIRPPVTATSEIGSPEMMKSHRRSDVSSLPDPYLFSPKAPRCSSRWKELLGLKKLYLNANAKHNQDSNRMASSSLPSHSCHNNSKSFKNFLHRKSSIDSSLSLPLLKDSDIETICMSSRLSLSSSSSGHEHDDLPRLSLDSEKPNMCPKNPNPNSNNNPPRVRLVRHRTLSSENTTARVGRSPIRRAPPDQTMAAAAAARGVSVDSPRMNSSGKIVFQGLERSSSSPSSLNGGPRFKHRGMERSYSANVRVTPVLNVPVCSLRGSSKSSSVFGFQLFSSQQKRDGGGCNGTGNRGQQSSNMRNRTVDHRA